MNQARIRARDPLGGSSLGALLVLLVAVMAAPAAPPSAPGSIPSSVPVVSGFTAFDGTLRLAGRDRYETAVAVAQHVSNGPATTVYVASGEDFPDSLAAAPLEGPLLLVPRRGPVPAAVQDELQRLDPAEVVILGGPSAVSDSVAQAMAAGRAMRRLAGTSRYETAAAIAVQGSHSDTVFLAAGDRFADALAAGPSGHPVLLVPSQGRVPAATIDAIRAIDPQRVVALGGTSAVPEASIREAAQGRATRRVTGQTRIDTAVALSRFLHTSPSAPSVTIARGDAFPDGLAASRLTDGPLLLVPRCGALPKAVADELRRLQPRIVHVLGGESAVCTRLLREAAAAAGVPAQSPPTASTPTDDPYRLAGDAWPRSRMPIRFTVASGRADWSTTVANAFATWAQHADLAVRQVTTTTDADVVVRWTTDCTGCGRPGGVLARATVGHQASNWIHFDAAEGWTTDGRGGIDLHTVALHEVGHVLGVGHSEVVQAVMYQYYLGPRGLHADDRTAVTARYGPKPAPTPSPSPSPAPGGLSVSFTENPFRCDGGLRNFGRVSGAQPGEGITFTSPQLGALTPGTADTGGELTIRWQCDPPEAGQRWQVTARGDSSGRTVTFTVTGASPPSPSPAPAPPSKSVTVAKGASAQGQPGCTASACRYVAVTLSNYAVHSPVTVECWSSLGSRPFYTYTMTTNGSGNGSSSVCYFGYPGEKVWVVAGGKKSNEVRW